MLPITLHKELFYPKLAANLRLDFLIKGYICIRRDSKLLKRYSASLFFKITKDLFYTRYLKLLNPSKEDGNKEEKNKIINKFLYRRSFVYKLIA